MRTLPLVVVLLVVNDVALALLLDVQLPGSTVVVGGAIALSATVLAIVAFTVDDDGDPPTRRELQEEVETLRARVDDLEN